MSTTARSPHPVRLWLMIAALVALAVVRAAGATPTAPRVEGTYILDPAASDDVLKAIDGVVAEMSSFKAPFARRRLRTLNQPPKRIDIASSDSDVSITTDERETIRTSPDGRPVQWRRDDGETFTIHSVWAERTLKRTFVADDGERANSYAFSPDGATLRMSVVLTSPQLPAPLAYTLVYRRITP